MNLENIDGSSENGGMGGCYISYSNSPNNWILKDGSKPPSKIYFIDPTFDKVNRGFKGKIDWGSNTF
jgi:hypothetical protein